MSEPMYCNSLDEGILLIVEDVAPAEPVELYVKPEPELELVPDDVEPEAVCSTLLTVPVGMSSANTVIAVGIVSAQAVMIVIAVLKTLVFIMGFLLS